MSPWRRLRNTPNPRMRVTALSENQSENEIETGNDADYRDYLMTVAELHLEPALRMKLDASDIVQQTLLEAHQTAHTFQGTTRAEKAGWLKRILLNNLIDVMRSFRRDKRDIAREQNIHRSINQSTARLSAVLAADQASPASVLIQDEQGLLLAQSLAKLPEAQRDAIVLQHFHGWSVAEIAEEMGRSRTAVAGLLKRGLRALRSDMRA